MGAERLALGAEGVEAPKDRLLHAVRYAGAVVLHAEATIAAHRPAAGRA